VQKLVAGTKQLRQGFDTQHDYSVDVGAMANEQQLKIVARHVDDAVSKGAKVLAGGEADTTWGYFYRPTVLVDVDHGMDCMREETFGPTLPVMKVGGSGRGDPTGQRLPVRPVGQRIHPGQAQGDGRGQTDEHRHGEHQQRADGSRGGIHGGMG
jgi:hypothetical protein